MKRCSTPLLVTRNVNQCSEQRKLSRLKPLAFAVVTAFASAGYTADNTGELSGTLTSSTQITVETANYVDDSELLARAQEKIDADSRVIDAMSQRIKEMIRARHNIEASNLKNKRIIEQLKQQLANLNTERDEADNKHRLLLSERDDLIRQLNGLRDKNATDRENIATLNGLAKKQEGIIASLENDLKNLRTGLQSKHAGIAQLEQQLARVNTDQQRAREEIDSLNAALINASQASDNLSAEKNSLVGEINRLQNVADQSLATERDAHSDTRNQLANAQQQLHDEKDRLTAAQQRLADLQAAHNALSTEKTALQATTEGLNEQLAHLQGELDSRVTEIQAANSDFVDLRQKINDKEADLMRSSGQLADATRQVNELQEQIAKLARDRDNATNKNAALQSNIDELESALAMRETDYDNLKDQYQSDQARQTDTIAGLNKEINALKNQITSATADQLALQREFDNSQKDIGRLNAALLRNNQKRDEIASQKQQLIGDVQGLNNSNSSLQDELAALNARNKSLLDERNALTADKLALNKERQSLAEQREAQARQLETLAVVRDELAAERDSLSIERDSLAENVNGLRAERDSLQAALDALTKEKKSLAADKIKLSNRAMELAKERDNLSANIQSINAKTDNLLKDKNSLTAENRKQAEMISALKSQLNKLQKDADAVGARLASHQQSSTDQINQLQQALQASQQELESTNSRLHALMQENEQIDNERDRLAADSEALRQKLEDELAAAELNFITVQKAREDSSIPLRLGSADFFATGSAELTKEGRENLKKLTDIITKFEDRRIVVAGHTDSKKIGQKLKPKFFSNWELSVARAAAAVRFMQHESNIDPTNISAAGYSEYSPIADNATKAGRQMNRRVEVVLYPRVEKERLYSELDE